MIETNQYLTRTYPPDYTCVHFVRDVWKDLTGNDIGQYAPGLHGNPELAIRHGFVRLNKPRTPCLVWMKGLNESHAGVYVDGRILHLKTGVGAMFQDVSGLLPFYKELRYYVSPTAD